MTQMKTKYTGVYVDDKGNFFYQTELGIDKITGKRIRKKVEKIKMVISFLLRSKRTRNSPELKMNIMKLKAILIIE